MNATQQLANETNKQLTSNADAFLKFAKQDAKDAKALIAELLASTDPKEAKKIGEELAAAVIAMAQNKRSQLEDLAMVAVINAWKPPTE